MWKMYKKNNNDDVKDILEKGKNCIIENNIE